MRFSWKSSLADQVHGLGHNLALSGALVGCNKTAHCCQSSIVNDAKLCVLFSLRTLTCDGHKNHFSNGSTSAPSAARSSVFSSMKSS